MKHDARAFLAAGLLLACGAFAFCPPARAQEAEDPAIAGMSRQLRMGIRYYEKGDDLQAMDRFMDVLTKGDPAERSMANEYINLITHRMNSGQQGPAPQRPSTLRPAGTVAEDSAAEEPAPTAPAAAAPVRAAASAASAASPARAPELVVGEPDSFAVARPQTERPVYTPPPAPRAARAAAEPAMPSANKALMKREIKAKLHSGLDEGLATLRGIDGLRLLMMSNGDPQAIAIPSPLLFQSGIAFQKDAAKILDALTKVVFSLGGAQAVILPEGTTIGDAKVLDMRRTMGISAHLFSAGVAPPRVRVNLLNTQVDIPKPLSDFRGIIVVFVYNQPLSLVVESALGEEAGPPVSLGLYPTTIRPDKGEGSVIEFSVQDPPAGLVSWKFQLLEPSEGGPTDLAPLQEVVGGNAVFHQIYWNGRRNYFGAPLAAGRYEAVLTASDTKGRQRTLHRWIQVLDAAGNSSVKAFAAPASAPAAAVTPAGRAASAAPTPVAVEKVAAGAPSAELSADKSQDEPLIKEGAAPKKKGKRAKPAARRPASKKKAAPAPAAEEAADAADAGSEEAAPAAGAKTAAAGAGAAGAAAAETPAPASSGGAKPSKPSSGSYDLQFTKDTHQLTPEAEKRLAQVADTVAYYPMESLKIQGFAQSTEANAAQLAERRAKMVAGLLINKYQIDPKKIQVASSVSEAAAFRVQVSFVKDQ